MKHIFLALAVLLLIAAGAWAQPHRDGAVEGQVLLPDGQPAAGARVALDGVGGGHHGGHGHFRTMADNHGNFGFRPVPIGLYTVHADLRMRGFAAELIEVLEGQTTHVTLTLQRRDSTHHPDSLTIVDLEGTAIVVPPPDSTRRCCVRYFLDVDGDNVPDYRLNFGPPWYHPDNGAQRPQNGDQITIRGGLFGYSEPPMVVVYEINGLFWRRPGHGHGGHGGGDHWRRGCDPDSITRIELEGTAHLYRCPGFHGDALRTLQTEGGRTFFLDFGAPDYDPGNGAQRPADGEEISIVGGLIYCRDLRPFCEQDPAGIVIVYEINGLFWREPGDTSGLGPMTPEAVDDPIRLGEPVSYVVARNYPNPFNPVTTIEYSIPVSGDVTLRVFDITGREVASLVSDYQSAGTYAVPWDGSAQSSGIYFYRLSVGNLTFTNRMVLMK